MAYPVMWFEVMGTDAARTRAFYREMFGWEARAGDPAEYGVINPPGGQGIPGGIGQPYPGGGRPWVTFYVETPSVQASLDQAVRLGGTVVIPRTEAPEVTLGVFEDPEGHVIGLVEAKSA